MTKDTPSIEDLIKSAGASSAAAPAPVPAQASAKPDGAPAFASAQSSTPDSEEKTVLEEKFADIRLKEKEKEAMDEATLLGIQYINLHKFAISPEALRQIPREQSEKLKTIAFLYTGSEIRLGAVNPADVAVKELLYQLEERLKTHGAIYKISEYSYGIANKLYDALPKITPIIKGVQISEKELSAYQEKIQKFKDVQPILNNVSITDILIVIIAAALKFDSSDIHVEAEENRIATRLRIDGELQDIAILDKELWKKIISRIKLISGLKININDRPQDGHMTIFIKEGKIDVRVSTLPTTWGESVVMRLLKPSAIKVEFSGLGFRKNALTKLEREISKPHGMILATGPTGSGKTTTLYAILRLLNKPDVKIITLEDPVEYKLEGINQSQIDHTKHYSFADGLRSILRQDPDIIMVGEIRDLETAETSINSALTGHMLLSTVHTNDAAGAIPRLISMGVKPFLLAPALNAIIAQRLVRKIHEACKEEIKLDPEMIERLKKIVAEIPQNSGESAPDIDKIVFYHGRGCDECNQTGYKGRIGIYEILAMDEQVANLIKEGAVSEYQMREIAKAQGMVSMVQDGILKAVDGITSIDEVFRVATE